MADEKPESQNPSTENTEEKSGSKFKLILVIAAIVVLAGGGVGAAFALGLFGSGDSGDESAPKVEAVEVSSSDTVGPIFQLKSFIVNLADQDQNRYLKVTIELELTNKEIAGIAETSKAKIKDTLVSLLSSKTFAQVRDIKGKIKLRQEIILRLNEIIGQNAITQVYFTEFIVQ